MIQETTANWIRTGLVDIHSAHHLYKAYLKLEPDDRYYNVIMYPLSQGVEKFIKAMYIDVDLEYPRIHRILKLFKTFQEQVGFEVDKKVQKAIKDFDMVAVQERMRYPDDGTLPYENYSKEDIDIAFDNVKTITLFCLVHLGPEYIKSFGNILEELCVILPENNEQNFLIYNHQDPE